MLNAPRTLRLGFALFLILALLVLITASGPPWWPWRWNVRALADPALANAIAAYSTLAVGCFAAVAPRPRLGLLRLE